MVVGCGESENMFLIKNVEAQKSLVTELKSRNIKVRIGSDGGVWFPQEQAALVEELAMKIMSSSKPSETTYAYVEQKYTELLISKLKDNSVPHKIIYKDKIKNVTLNYENEEQWQPLKDEVDDLFTDEKRKELGIINE